MLHDDFFKKVLTADEALPLLAVPWQREADGSFLVMSDLNLAERGLKFLPDLSNVAVKFNFTCSRNSLTSLKGAPKSVGIRFSCEGNLLGSLDFASQDAKEFFCERNQLQSLHDIPKNFRLLASDFGDFTSYSSIPLKHRTLPGGELSQNFQASCAAQRSFNVRRKPLHFKFSE